MTTSYNGWPAAQVPAAIGVAPFIVNGVPFPGGVKAGDVAVVFTHLVTEYAKRVEPLITPGCWGYFYKPSANDAALISCHSSGTAIDLCAPKHPNNKRGTFSFGQVAAIHAILAELGGVVHWGGDGWGPGSTIDEMHFEIAEGRKPADVAAVAARLRGVKPVVPAPATVRLPDMVFGRSAQVNLDFQRWYNAFPFSPALLPIIAPLSTNFGPQTLEAIKRVQARYGLKADGLVGPATKALLWRLGFRG